MAQNGLDNKSKMPRFNLNWLYIIIIGGLAFMLFQGQGSGSSISKDVAYSDFCNYVAEGYGSEVIINKTDGTARMMLKPDADKVRKIFGQGLDRTGNSPSLVTDGPADIDKLGEFVKTYKAKGLAWLAPAQEWRGSILKFVDSESRDALLERSGAAEGDLLLIVADPDNRVVLDALGHLRAEVAAKRGLFDPATDKLLWVTDFPLLEWDEEAGRYSAMHHPFTMPMDEDIPLLDTDPGQVRAKAYDIVMNGYELGGGSIRIHDRDLQNRMFGLLGFTEEAAYANFSFLLDAFSYGVPPHGGLAIGLDRLIMLLAGLDNIREVIAFPKVQTSADLMTQAPGEVSRKQLDELGLLIETSGTDQDASMEAAKENE